MTRRLRSHGPRLSLPIPSPTRLFRAGKRTPDDRATLVALVHDFVLPHARHDFSCRTRRFPDDQAALVAGSTIVFTGPEPGVGISPRQDVTSAHLFFFVRAARKALAEKAKAERDATRAAEKETKRREQRDAKQLQAMCNLMTTTLMTRLMSQMSPGAMKEK